MDAIGRLDNQPWERKENPQSYSLLPMYGEHPKPAQQMLGVLGGNNAPYKNRQSQVELESDLRGITRPNTFCPDRQHLPSWKTPGYSTKEVVRTNPKENVKIPVITQALKPYQMWAYPATLAPEPFTLETCGKPEKY